MSPDKMGEYSSLDHSLRKLRKIFFVGEKRPLIDFLYFLEKFPNSILIGVDDYSILVLPRKLKYLNSGMFQRLVKGFSHWRRILRYLDVQHHKNI